MNPCYRSKIFSALIFWFALLLSQVGFAQGAGSPVFTPRGVGHQTVDIQYEYLEDSDGTLSFHDVRSGKGGPWKPLEKNNFGFGYKKVLWVRFAIDFSHFPEQEFYLFQNFEFVWRYSVFYPEQGTYKVKELNELKPAGAREFLIHNYLFSLPTPAASPAVYYVRMDPGGHVLTVDLAFSGKKGAVEYLHYSMLAIGLVFGAVLAMLGYNVVLYYYLRSKDYFYYLYYLTCLTLIFVYINGFGPLIFKSIYVTEAFFAAAGYGAIHGMVLFARQFLSLRMNARHLDRYFVICQGVLFAGMIGALFLPIGVPFPILNVIILFTTPALVYAGYVRWRQGFAPAGLYLLGWVAFVSGLGLYALRLQGVLPSNLFTNHLVQIAAVWETMLFALALVYRIKLSERQASQAKNAFLGMISHELKTPLQGITSAIDLLSVHLHKPRDIEIVERLKTASEHLDTQVKDLTDFARLESGNLKLKPKVFSFAHLATTTVEGFRGAADKKGLDLRLKLGAGSMTINSDEVRIQQILNNLISNAVRYTETGHVEVRSRLLRGKAPALELVVEDSGIGIDSQDFQALFEPFRQLDQSSTRKHEGFGMGLSVVRKLSEVFQGAVTVDSHVGKGSTFTVTIPVEVVDHPEDYGSTAAVSSDEQADDVRILLVDDNESVRQSLRDLVNEIGYACDTAACGKEALQLARSMGYAVILLDINMPDLDGFEVAQLIRKNRRDRNYTTPIVWISATTPEDISLEQKALFTHFLEKPIRLHNLAAVMRELVD